MNELIPNWKTNFGKKTFHYKATKLWNKLPPNIHVNFNKMSVNQFKNAIIFVIILQQMYNNKMMLKSVFHTR